MSRDRYRDWTPAEARFVTWGMCAYGAACGYSLGRWGVDVAFYVGVSLAGIGVALAALSSVLLRTVYWKRARR